MRTVHWSVDNIAMLYSLRWIDDNNAVQMILAPESANCSLELAAVLICTRRQCNTFSCFRSEFVTQRRKSAVMVSESLGTVRLVHSCYRLLSATLGSKLIL